MKIIKVSYLLTSFNRAKYFTKALDNIREFKSKNDELIVIDGGSTDETKKIAKKNKDLIDLFISEEDEGEAHALNKGLLAATGKYIKILTDDDYIYPKQMKVAIKVLERNPELEAVQCGGTSVIQDSKTGIEKIGYYPQIFPEVNIVKQPFHLMTYAPCGLGLIFKRNLLSKIGLFDITYRAVDLHIMSRLVLLKTNFKYLNINLYKHISYEHSGQNFTEDIHKDEVKTLLAYGYWERFINYEDKILSDILGLSKVENGYYMVRIIRFLDKVRTGKLSFFIKYFSYVLKVLFDLKDLYKKIKSLLNKKRNNYLVNEPIEPIRDGKFW
jgi:glycosyltransferase involved in cell wall biosynthesis